MTQVNVSSGCCPYSGKSITSSGTTSSTDTVDEVNIYENLYNSFVNDGTEPAIPAVIHAQNEEADKNDFIAIGGTEMLIHSLASESASEKTNAVVPFRKGGVAGFVEMTSISHMVPALCYMVENGMTQSEQRATFETNVNDLLNNEDLFKWLEPDQNPPQVFADRVEQTKALITYALSHMSSFLESHPDGFELADVMETFDLNANDNTDEIPYWRAVMVGTFEMVVLMTIDNLTNTPEYAARLSAIDWANVEVLFCGQTGAASAGLNRATNSTFKYLKGVAAHLDSAGVGFRINNVYFTPYADLQDWGSTETEVAETYETFKTVWNNLDDRVVTSSGMFANLTVEEDGEQLTIPDAIKSMYNNRLDGSLTMEEKVPVDESSVKTILDSLTHRMAWTMIDYRDTLSDCVTERVLNLWKAAGYSTKDTRIDGLDTVTYPSS